MTAITLRGVRKTYRIGVGRARVREMLPPPLDRAVARLLPRWWYRNTFNALDDVSVEIPAGSTLGIVGANGAGKTTMLKVIAAVTAPSAGSVEVTGRVGALIDVLVGFHPDLTGAENAYLLGAIHGLSRREMASRLDKVLEFAEIDDLAETPVKRYSAGMQARLGFATLVSIEPEILLIDEVLAVGDAAFQRKCIEWLTSYRDRGGTLVFVSHNLALVRSMTARAVWLDHGKIAKEGETGDVLGEYAKAMERRDPGLDRQRAPMKVMRRRGMYRWGAGGATVRNVDIKDPTDGDRSLDISITYEATSVDRAVFCVGFLDEAGREVAVAASPEVPVKEGGTVRCAIRPAPFRPGVYFPVAAILSPDGQVQDRWRLERAIVVEGDGETAVLEGFGPVQIPSRWTSQRGT